MIHIFMLQGHEYEDMGGCGAVMENTKYDDMVRGCLESTKYEDMGSTE